MCFLPVGMGMVGASLRLCVGRGRIRVSMLMTSTTTTITTIVPRLLLLRLPADEEKQSPPQFPLHHHPLQDRSNQRQTLASPMTNDRAPIPKPSPSIYPIDPTISTIRNPPCHFYYSVTTATTMSIPMTMTTNGFRPMTVAAAAMTRVRATKADRARATIISPRMSWMR